MKEKFKKLCFKKDAIFVAIVEIVFLILICVPITISLFKNDNLNSGNISPVDSYNNPVTEESDESNIETSNYSLVYSKNQDTVFERTINFDDKDYNIVVSKDGKSIRVNEKEIYKTDEQVNSIYYLNDVFILNTSNVKDKLISVDFSGNIKVLEEQKAIISIESINEETISYSIKSYDRVSGEIYVPHYTYTYKINYLGYNNFTKPDLSGWNSNYTTCMNEYNGYCLLNDDPNFMIELKDPDYDSDVHITYLMVNNHKLTFNDYGIIEMRMLNDGYLYVSMVDTGIGYDNKVYIIDSDGDIVNDVDNYIDDLMIDTSKFNDGVISYYTDAIDSVENACGNLDYNGLKLNSIVFKSVDLKYIGGGKLKVIERKELTFSEYLKELGFDSCEAVLKS